MNVSNEDETSFLKIILDDTVDYFPLPTAFAIKYLEKGNKKKQTLVLKTKSSDVKWIVKYYKIEDRHYFMDGWLKFMTDNRLQLGDFLVFYLLSPSPNLIFQVFFYQHKTCLSLKRPSTVDRTPVIVGKRVTTPTDDVGTGDDDKRRKQKTKKKALVKEEETSEDESSESMQKSSSMRRVVRKSYMRHMPMTEGFFKATGIKIKHGGVTGQLRNDDGQKWEVEIKRCTSRKIPYITNGWSDFMKDNNITIGNTCEINHIKNNLLHVRVF